MVTHHPLALLAACAFGLSPPSPSRWLTPNPRLRRHSLSHFHCLPKTSNALARWTGGERWDCELARASLLQRGMGYLVLSPSPSPSPPHAFQYASSSSGATACRRRARRGGVFVVASAASPLDGGPSPSLAAAGGAPRRLGRTARPPP